jgi:hypothetical protein
MVCVIECSVKCARATYRLTKGLMKALWIRQPESRHLSTWLKRLDFGDLMGGVSAAGLAAGPHVLHLGFQVIGADGALHQLRCRSRRTACR